MNAFRIRINVKTGQFEIQIHKYMGMVWSPLCNPASPKEVWRFATYDDATAKINEIGLSKVYRDCTTAMPWSTSPRHMPPQPTPLYSTSHSAFA